jgi:hypothetical protein
MGPTQAMRVGIVAVLAAALMAPQGATTAADAQTGAPPAFDPEPRRAAIPLPLTEYGDILVNEERDQIFVSGGWDGGAPVVTDMAGRNHRQLPQLDQAHGMLLSPDGATLYVALTERNAIAEVDTRTFATLIVPTGADTCPTTLAWSDDTVWWGGRCVGWRYDGLLGAYDPVTRQVTTHLETDHYMWAPRLAASPLRPREILISELGQSPPELAVADVQGGPSPSVDIRVHLREAGGMDDFVYLSKDRVLLGGGAYHAHAVIDPEDLSQVGSYETGDDGMAVAMREDGLIAAGVHEYYGPGIYLFDRGSPRLQDRRALDLDPGRTLLDLRFGDGRLYAVVEPIGPDRRPHLHVFEPEKAEPVEVTMTTDRPRYEWGDRAELRVTVDSSGVGGIASLRKASWDTFAPGRLIKAATIGSSRSFTHKVLVGPRPGYGARFEYPDGSHSPIEGLLLDNSMPPGGWVRTRPLEAAKRRGRFAVYDRSEPARLSSDLYKIQPKRLVYRIDRRTKSGWKRHTTRSQRVRDFSAGLRIRDADVPGRVMRVRIIRGQRSARLTPVWTYVRHKRG